MIRLWRCTLLPALALAFMSPQARAQDLPEGSAEAVAAFAEGLKLYNQMDYAEALPHLYRAYELDNNFAVALFHAALCESNLSSGVSPDSIMKIVLESRHRLSPYYVLRAESYLAKRNGDRELGVTRARQAANLAPGTKAWYNLAYDLLPMNRPREARAALLRLDPDREPMVGWAAYFTVLESANHLLGRLEEAAAVTREARSRFPTHRNVMVAHAEALGALGLEEELSQLFDDAARTPATGAGNTVGALMTIAAAELKAHGHTAAGDGMYDRAVAWYERGESDVSAPVHQTWHTLALMGADRWEEALALCDQHLAAQPDYTWYHGAAAMAAARAGDPERMEEERSWYETQAPMRPPAFLPSNMAYFAAAEGRTEEAVALLQHAMDLGTAFNIWWHRDPVLEELQDHPAWKEFLRPKG